MPALIRSVSSIGRSRVDAVCDTTPPCIFSKNDHRRRSKATAIFLLGDDFQEIIALPAETLDDRCDDRKNALLHLAHNEIPSSDRNHFDISLSRGNLQSTLAPADGIGRDRVGRRATARSPGTRPDTGTRPSSTVVISTP
ncbi:hypothetical protein [Pinisolibacter sp.]|uniref:hypothetical protein n=1 Tax=Pinisolibacter sp. TaxID=2172024 RepID=UPI002FDE2B3C